MKQTVSSVLKTRSALIVTHLCVCSLSVGVTLAILNIHPVVGLVCFCIAIFCIASVIKILNKQLWPKKHLIIRFTRKDGKMHIEHSEMMAMGQKDDIQGQDQLKW